MAMPAEGLKEAIRKAIYDNLRDFGAAELGSTVNSEGNTCRQVLSGRNKLSYVDPDKYPCGKLFYVELRKVFRSSERPLSLIDAAAVQHVAAVSPCLIRGMLEFQKFGRKQGILGYLSLC